METKRLILRPISKEDIPAIANAANNALIAEQTIRLPYPYTLEHAKSFVEEVCVDNDRTLAVLLKEAKQFIGVISVEKQGELGFWLAQNFWGQGYGTEAMAAMVELAFSRLVPELELVKAAVFEDNPASIRVFENLGFTRVGCIENTVRERRRRLICFEQRRNSHY